MPRIPVRIEPYSSPVRQHRHFKTKRDQILKALGKAAYINGSQYMIMWVSARGQVETYASSVLQSKIKEWFPYEVIEEARRLVMENPIRHHQHQKIEEEDEDEDLGLDLDEGSPTSIDFEDEDIENRQAQKRASAGPSELVLRDRNRDDSLQASITSAPIKKIKLTKKRKSSSSDHPNVPVQTITLDSRKAVDEFLEAKFGQMQQNCCKTVAKAWIKVIEPKKQNKFPYNKGESAKPEWWPADVRHKEPDHLMKHERLQLLMTILRSPRVQRAQLELSTAEVSAFIPADKAIILKDIYNVAKEEERRQKLPGAQVYPLTVQICMPTAPQLSNPFQEPPHQDLSSPSLHITPLRKPSSSSPPLILPTLSACSFEPDMNHASVFDTRGVPIAPNTPLSTSQFHNSGMRSGSSGTRIDHMGTSAFTPYYGFFHENIHDTKPDHTYNDGQNLLENPQTDENGISNVIMSNPFNGFNFNTIYQDLPVTAQAQAMAHHHAPIHHDI